MDATETPTEIIQRLGGPAKTAELCEISTQAVSQWRINGIPRARLQFLKLARPDVFSQVAATKPANTESQPQ